MERMDISEFMEVLENVEALDKTSGSIVLHVSNTNGVLLDTLNMNLVASGPSRAISTD